MIIALIVAVAVFAYYFIEDNDWVLAITSGFVAFVIAGLIALLAGVATTETSTRTKELKLMSLERTSAVSGSFVLGCGTVEGGPAYCYYERVGEDTYVLRWVLADYAMIVEDDQCKLVKVVRYAEWSWWFWMKTYENPRRSYTFHIPKGSIKFMYAP